MAAGLQSRALGSMSAAVVRFSPQANHWDPLTTNGKAQGLSPTACPIGHQSWKPEMEGTHLEFYLHKNNTYHWKQKVINLTTFVVTGGTVSCTTYGTTSDNKLSNWWCFVFTVLWFGVNPRKYKIWCLLWFVNGLSYPYPVRLPQCQGCNPKGYGYK